MPAGVLAPYGTAKKRDVGVLCPYRAFRMSAEDDGDTCMPAFPEPQNKSQASLPVACAYWRVTRTYEDFSAERTPRTLEIEVPGTKLFVPRSFRPDFVAAALLGATMPTC